MLNSQLNFFSVQRKNLRTIPVIGGAIFAACLLTVVVGCGEKDRLHPPADMERALRIRGELEPDAEPKLVDEKNNQ